MHPLRWGLCIREGEGGGYREKREGKGCFEGKRHEGGEVERKEGRMRKEMEKILCISYYTVSQALERYSLKEHL